MTETVALRPPKPGIALRVGVTGSRKFVAKPLAGDLAQKYPLELPPERMAKIHEDVDAALRLVADRLRDFDRQSFYSDDPLVLRLVSPLAVGADRIVAKAARRLGFELYAPLPFARAEYEKDFPNDAEFADLIKDSAVFELDGARSQEEESYREVGRFVVRNSDLIIAIWNREPIRKVGGTSEIVRFALQSRVPVLWIDAYGEAPPRLLLSAARLREAQRGAHSEGWEEELALQVDRIANLPHEPVLCAALHEYLAEDVTPSPEDRWWATRFKNAYAGMLALFTHFWKPTPYARMQIDGRWNAFAEPADALGVRYSAAYRNAYVWIAIFAFLALLGPALALFVPRHRHIAAYVEAWSLSLIFILYRRSTAQKSHEKWIACRLLAELCRQQYVLSHAGRSIPVSECENTARHTQEPKTRSPQKEGEEEPFEAWVARYFAAAQRSAPPPMGDILERNREAIKIGQALIDEQRGYHSNRLEQQGAAGNRMTAAAHFCFNVTLALVLTHLTIEALPLESLSCLERLLEFGVGFFSALSAALLGVRAYAEFFLLKRQSQMMLRALKEAEERLSSIGPMDPLASRDIGRVLFSLMLAMMEDIKGWSQLYGVKNIEPS